MMQKGLRRVLHGNLEKDRCFNVAFDIVMHRNTHANKHTHNHPLN